MIDFQENTIDLDLFKNIINEIKENPTFADDIIDSYSNNQFLSKQKLIDMISQLPLSSEGLDIIIFGSWYGSILIPGLTKKAKRITGIDLNEDVLKIAKNRLFANSNNLEFITGDVFEKDLSRYHTADLIINTSCEHMHPMKDWPYWHKMKSNMCFAFQSNNMYGINGHINCVDSVEHFKNQLPDNCVVLDQHELVEERGTRFTLAGHIQ